MRFRVYEIQEASQKTKTDLQYVTVSHLPDYTVLHFPLNCCAGAAARQGRPQATINMAIPLSLLLIIFHSPPTSLAISLVKEDKIDNLQGLSTHSLIAGPPPPLPSWLLSELVPMKSELRQFPA